MYLTIAYKYVEELDQFDVMLKMRTVQSNELTDHEYIDSFQVTIVKAQKNIEQKKIYRKNNFIRIRVYIDDWADIFVKDTFGISRTTDPCPYMD